MIKIPFSPANPPDWPEPQTEGLMDVLTWFTRKSASANDDISSGKLQPFNAVVFKKAHLLDILAQDYCSSLAFYHLQVKDSAGVEVSTLFAVGEDEHGDRLSEEGNKFFVGTPVPVPFGNVKINNEDVSYTKWPRGLKWPVEEIKDREVSEWLLSIRNRGPFPGDVKMLNTTWLEKEEVQKTFSSENKEGLIAFFPGVFWCNVNPNARSERYSYSSGWYCTLVGCELAAGAKLAPEEKYKLFVCCNTYSPNWPKTTDEKLYEKLEELLFGINNLIAKLDEGK